MMKVAVWLMALPLGAVAVPAAPAVESPVAVAPAAPPAGERTAIDKVVADYIDLYARPTLDRWKTLFHPRLLVVSPKDDGTVRIRGLEEFFKAQKDRFETGRRIGERLENVRIEPGRRIARVTADFVFSDEGEESRGKLGLHLARDGERWVITAIIFSYDEP
jgi:hypothetical protein